jgi:very-short-patch-repair endonuclease
MVSAAVRVAPLCHLVTSPPHGGRVGTHALRHPNSDLSDVNGDAGGVPLSPLVGEMSGRTEGGTAHATPNTPLAIAQNRPQSARRLKPVMEAAMNHTPIPPQRRASAKRMRKEMTDAERKLWGCLRAHRLMGLGFRRQVPVAGFILDFACPDHKLIVEVDGSQHGNDTDLAYDAARTRRLEQDGWTVLRFWNDDVLRDIDNVCQHIVIVAGKEWS